MDKHLSPLDVFENLEDETKLLYAAVLGAQNFIDEPDGCPVNSKDLSWALYLALRRFDAALKPALEIAYHEQCREAIYAAFEAIKTSEINKEGQPGSAAGETLLEDEEKALSPGKIPSPILSRKRKKQPAKKQ